MSKPNTKRSLVELQRVLCASYRRRGLCTSKRGDKMCDQCVVVTEIYDHYDYEDDDTEDDDTEDDCDHVDVSDH